MSSFPYKSSQEYYNQSQAGDTFPGGQTCQVERVELPAVNPQTVKLEVSIAFMG